MSIAWEDSFVTQHWGDAREILAEIPPESIQCCITSPPYYGLRKYDGEQNIAWSDGQKCAFGLERDVQSYVKHTVDILESIKKVLRKDGVVFWNIGDSYNGSGGCHKANHKNDTGFQGKLGPLKGGPGTKDPTLKTKDLCLIPFRIAVSAQEAGWWVRSTIIWNKPNPMPEPVKDRPARSHEYILMLTKTSKYYWDANAIKEPVATSTIGRGPVDFGSAKGRNYKPDKGDPNYRNGSEQWGRTYDYTKSSSNGRNSRDVWNFPTTPFKGAHFATFPIGLPTRCIQAASKVGDIILDPFSGSGTTGVAAKQLNRRSVLIDLSADYCALSLGRVSKIAEPVEEGKDSLDD